MRSLLALVFTLALAAAAAAQTPSSITTFSIPGAGTLAGQGTLPEAINANGEIVGTYYDSAGLVHGFIRSKTGTITSFDAFGGNQNRDTVANGVNLSGAISGDYLHCLNLQCESVVSYGFLRSPVGRYNEIAAPGATGTIASAINDSSEVVGWWTDNSAKNHGYFWQSNVLTSFDVPGALSTEPFAVNASGEIAGIWNDGITNHGFLRDSLGNFTTFDPPGATITWTRSINTSGQISGAFVDALDVEWGFILETDGSFTTYALPGKAGTFYSGFGYPVINDSGEVAGVAVANSGSYSGYSRSSAGQIREFTVDGGNTWVEAINSKGHMTGSYIASGGSYYGFLF